MTRLCGLDGDRFDRFSMVARDDIIDTFGHDEGLDDMNSNFMMPRKVERRCKPSF